MRSGGARAPGTVPALVFAFSASLLLSGCATLQELTALRRVDFSLAGVSEGTLAGVPIEAVRDVNEISPLTMARLATALSSGDLPLEAVFEIQAENPEDNVRARLVALDWTLFLDDRETVSGFLDEEYLLPPGEPVIVPLRVEVDLVQLYDRLDRVVGLALAVAGAGEPRRVRLEAVPTVQTPLGPIRYPEPILIEHEVGG